MPIKQEVFSTIRPLENQELSLMDDIMNALNNADYWQKIQTEDPAILFAQEQFEVALDEIKSSINDEQFGAMCDSAWNLATAFTDAGIMYGLHAGNVIAVASSRPIEVSTHTLMKMKGE